MKNNWINKHEEHIENKLCYKSSIEKEQPKQETLEEFANKTYPFYGDVELREAIELGAKWQQKQDKNKLKLAEHLYEVVYKEKERMYSEEEVEDITKDAYAMGRKGILIGGFNKWFNKFKNK